MFGVQTPAHVKSVRTVSNLGRIKMRKTLLTAVAAAALLSGGMLGNRAEAMTLATPSALGVALADTGVVQKVVCGYNGCVRVRPRYYGYYGRPYRNYRRPYAW
jgi:hypothetical protein